MTVCGTHRRVSPGIGSACLGEWIVSENERFIYVTSSSWPAPSHHVALLSRVRVVPYLFLAQFRYYMDRLGGLVVKASASRAEDPGFESRLRRDFSGSSHTSDLTIGTPVATLSGAWRY